MEDKIKKIKELAPKNRFSLYHKTGETGVRVYFSDGTQHKERGETIYQALDKMIDNLENKNRQK